MHSLVKIFFAVLLIVSPQWSNQSIVLFCWTHLTAHPKGFCSSYFLVLTPLIYASTGVFPSGGQQICWCWCCSDCLVKQPPGIVINHLLIILFNEEILVGRYVRTLFKVDDAWCLDSQPKFWDDRFLDACVHRRSPDYKLLKVQLLQHACASIFLFSPFGSLCTCRQVGNGLMK